MRKRQQEEMSLGGAAMDTDYFDRDHQQSKLV